MGERAWEDYARSIHDPATVHAMCLFFQQRNGEEFPAAGPGHHAVNLTQARQHRDEHVGLRRQRSWPALPPGPRTLSPCFPAQRAHPRR